MRKQIIGLAFCISISAVTAVAQNTFPSIGNAGIGTTAPNNSLTIVGAANPNVLSLTTTSSGGHLWGLGSFGTLSGYNTGGFGIADWTAGSWRMYLDGSGNVGIGTTTPAYTLDVAGKIHTSAGITFPDGNTQTVAFDPSNCGADYAEAINVTGDRTKYEPGDILVIDPTTPGKFLKSSQPYSSMVSGIYSTKPGFVGRKEPADPSTSAQEVPMAMVGRVPTKVSAENGPIKVGDLLVTSSTLGYAMKGTDRNQMLGAVVGKALGSLDSGTGVIEVLVTLQ